jgi:hypothetical protein
MLKRQEKRSSKDKAENEPQVPQKRRLLVAPEIGMDLFKGDDQVISLLQVQRELQKEYEPWAGSRF